MTSFKPLLINLEKIRLGLLNRLISRLPEFFVICLIFVYLLLKGIREVGDTGAYFTYFYNRPPLIPLFFNLAKSFSETNYNLIILLTHIIFGIVVIFSFTKFVCRNSKIKNQYNVLILIVLFTPYLFGLKIANVLSSEGISYPLFLLTIKYLIDWIITIQTRKFVQFSITLSLLILTRGQFLLFYPLLLVVLSIYFIKNKLRILKIITILGILTAGVLSNAIIERAYNYAIYGHFEKTNFNWWLITPAFYISTPSDTLLFKNNPELKSIFKKIHLTLNANGLTMKTFMEKNSSLNEVKYYGDNVNPIYHIIEKELIDKFQFYQPKTTKFDFEKIYFVNQFCNQLSTPILKNNAKQFFILWANYFIEWMGGYSYTVFFIIIYALTTFSLFKINIVDFTTLFLWLSQTISLANCSLLALFANYERRYTLYNDTIILLSILLLLINYVNNIEKYQKKGLK